MLGKLRGTHSSKHVILNGRLQWSIAWFNLYENMKIIIHNQECRHFNVYVDALLTKAGPVWDDRVYASKLLLSCLPSNLSIVHIYLINMRVILKTWVHK